MMFFRLICKDENRKVVSDILEANNLSINNNSKIVLVEESLDNFASYDLKITFKMEAILELINLVQNLKGSDALGNLLLGKCNETYTPINLDDVCYFNAINNFSYANLSNGKTYIVKNKLYELERDFKIKNFVRINKSEIVNIKKINLIIPMFKGKLIIHLEGYKTPFDISRGYTKSFKERLGL